MSILVVCPKCACKLNVPESMAGRKVGCPQCAQHLTVPAGVSGRPQTETLSAPPPRSGGAPKLNRPPLPVPPPRVNQTAAVSSPARSVPAGNGASATGTGWRVGLIAVSASAILAVGVLGVALLRSKTGPGGEARAAGTAAGEQVADASPSSANDADQQKPDSSSSKKRGKAASSAKKDADSDDAPSSSSSRADAGQRVYRNMLKSAVFIINFEVLPNKRRVVSSGSGSLVDRETAWC
jgi:hypothetical protein